MTLESPPMPPPPTTTSTIPSPTTTTATPHQIGRYVLGHEIAAGGMATVHLGRMTGEAGFRRTVAIKRLHPFFAREKEFVDMFVDEARLAARIQHPNVVSTLDVLKQGDELLLVMEYLHGESVAKIARAVQRDHDAIPLDIAVAILCDGLHGLHAAHEATNESGEPLAIVHRDVSPHNLLVGADGITRVVDFGVAKAVGRLTSTRDGQVKGKIAYMAPEQLRGETCDRRADVYAAGIVLWETLTGQRLFAGDNDGATVTNVLSKTVPRPSSIRSEISSELDEMVMRALAREPRERFSTAREMASALERACKPASARGVAEWLSMLVGDSLSKRRELISALESSKTEKTSEGEGTPLRIRPAFDSAALDARTETTPEVRRPRQLRVVAILFGALVGTSLVLVVVLFWTNKGLRPSPAVATTTTTTATTATTTTSEESSVAAVPSPSSSSSSSSASPQVPATAPSSSASTAKRKPVRPKCHVTFVADSEGIEHPRTVCQ